MDAHTTVECPVPRGPSWRGVGACRSARPTGAETPSDGPWCGMLGRVPPACG